MPPDRISIQAWRDSFSDLEKLIDEEQLGQLASDKAKFHHNIAEEYLKNAGDTLDSHEIKKLDHYQTLIVGDIQEGIQFHQKIEAKERADELRKWELAESAARMALTLTIAYVAAPAAAGATTAVLADSAVASILATGARGAALAAAPGAGVGLGSSSAAAFGLFQAMGIGTVLGGMAGAMESIGIQTLKEDKTSIDTGEVWAKVKSEALNGAITATIPAFSRIRQALTAETAASKAFGHYGRDILDGALLGAADSAVRDIKTQRVDEGAWKTNWLRTAEAAQSGVLFGAAGAAVLGPLFRSAGEALSKPSKIFTHAHPPEPTTWDDAVKEILEYRPPVWSVRKLIGGIERVMPEGTRRIPRVIQTDPAVRALFTNTRGVVDFDQALSPHKQALLIERLGINIVNDKSTLATLDPASPTYHADYMGTLKNASEIDDATMGKLLRFLGINFRSGSAAEIENLGYARMGWKNTQRIIKDNDDTSNNGWGFHYALLMPYTFGKALLQTAISGAGKSPKALLNGEVAYHVFNRNKAFEVAKVLSTGRLIPIKTDNVKPFMTTWYQMFPTDRFAHTGKFAFQNITLKEVMDNPFIVDANSQVEGLNLLLEKLRTQGYARLNLDEKKAVSVAAHDPNGYKMKIWVLDKLRRPDLPELWDDAILVDNCDYYARTQAVLGKKAIEVQDRRPPILPGIKPVNDVINYVLADFMGAANLAARRMGWRGMEELTNNMGWFNHLPASMFGVTSYLQPALKQMEKGTAKLVRFNSPPSLADRFFKPIPQNGLKPGNQVQVGSYTIQWPYYKVHFEGPRQEAKKKISQIRTELERQKAWDSSRNQYDTLATSRIPGEKIWGDSPKSPTE